MKQLYKRTTHKKLGGVASGLADYFEIDPIIIRVLFLVGFFLGGSSLLLYIILWFMMPKDFEVMGNRNNNQSNNYNNASNYNNNNNSNDNNMQYSNIKEY
ncbi:MAG: PspC domain-containing protein [Candidatus Kapaibacteriota bacterium]|jgi:phage shock protein PspC (stress-responsive transcriptional regulator)